MEGLELKNLSINISDNQNIIENLDLQIQKGSVYVLFGPNGAGKSSLIRAIGGWPSYNVSSGSIHFNDTDITSATVDKRAASGIATAFQLPPEIVGVKLRDMLKICLSKNPAEKFSDKETSMIESFNLTSFLDRDINVNFSGGEKKRAEILQLLFMKPQLMLIDEPDSGVDVQTLQFIGQQINDYLQTHNCSALIVTHQGNILEHVKVDEALVLVDKQIRCRGHPEKIFDTIKTKGYEECKKCQGKKIR